MWVVGFVWEFEYVVKGGVWWVMNMWMRIDVSSMREEEVMEVCWDGYVHSLLRRHISMLICVLDDGICRFEGDDCYGDGWDSVRGYSVSIDLWEMDGNE